MIYLNIDYNNLEMLMFNVMYFFIRSLKILIILIRNNFFFFKLSFLSDFNTNMLYACVKNLHYALNMSQYSKKCTYVSLIH